MAGDWDVGRGHRRDPPPSAGGGGILPDSSIALAHVLRGFTRVGKGMVVYPDRMLENLGRSRGVVFSGTLLLELAKRGVSREQAYTWVQRNAMQSFDERRDFKTLLLADSDVMGILEPIDVERAFDLEEQFRHVDAIFERVFGTTGDPQG